ncbi:hypothetical protein M9Y10_033792 [Tritrichomonas musculus]|uniref:SecA family profile domain-containing protein n=1 Tax=Tritrichomonas musculus TaxID=1915356 RepID=A0ABR2KD52_9EUKA
MPILDPSLQLYLLCNYDPTKTSNKDFFLRYLQIAASNINLKLDTIQASIQFKEDLKSGSAVISEVFEDHFSFDVELNNPTISNFYRYLFDKINSKFTKNISKNQKGNYYIYKDIFQIRLFQPSVEFSFHHAWYLTDSPIAILCVNLENFQEKDIKIFSYINLEIDLMAASGFTLVLSFIGKIKSSITDTFIKETLVTHQFAEIHFNLLHSFGSTKKFFSYLQQNEKYLSDNGYLYLYTEYFKQSVVEKNHFKKYKSEKPFFRLFFYSDEMIKAMKHGTMSSNFRFCHESSSILYKYKPFVYCKTGFDQDLIRVLLCNVPLYNTANEKTDLVPYCTSGISIAYLSKDDFLDAEGFRVRILYDDVVNNHNLIEKYVDFDDIHLIRPDFYVNDTLYLARTEKNTLNIVKGIQGTAETKFMENQGEDFKKEGIFHLFKSQQIKKGLQYVTFAYQHYATYANSLNNFHVHTNQIFTAFEACNVCLLNAIRSTKGVVYQVETGEGKSCIIQIIAAVLALSKKTVHITSSNINLANRDYYDSLEFFKKLDLESAVLLHYNELPYINFQNLPNDNTVYTKDFFPDKFFHRRLFRNSSRMNFSVCGFNNKNGLSKDKANIIFSNFINFESLYLRMMEIYPAHITEYFKNCSLLIDEADSILIDELTNGTILSRPMNTNGKEILKFVYQCHQENREVDDTYNEVKQRWPKCSDLSKDDIIQMYKEIDIVNQPEFTNGKKYSIEKFYVKDKPKNIKQKAENKVNEFKEKSMSKVKKFFYNLRWKNKKQAINKSQKKPEKQTKTKEKAKEKNEDEDKDLEYSEYSEYSQYSSYSSTDYDSEISDYSDYEENESLDDKNNDEENVEKQDKENEINKLLPVKEEKEIEETKTEINEGKKKTEEKSIVKEFKMIVPFDYDHKGILEPNKEFSGFIQQFIAIKEIFNNKENENMIIKDVSMNYLYVSHPIFVKLYSGVCGLTGTVGNKYDKQILEKHYNLITKKIPRDAPNHRIELPSIICSTIKERNAQIVNEVIEYHAKEIPVLVIFRDLNEISYVYQALFSKGIKNINIFDGKDEKIKPDKIAGLKGAVSLGTNVCGRGTDIKEPSKPLHVVVTYYTSNTRVMYQAFGRTARQGKDGTVRVICLMSQFLSPQQTFTENSMQNVLSDFTIKNDLQIKFIEEFRKKRRWIFDSNIRAQKISKEYIQKMRNARINVNRIKVFNYEFPLCMDVSTFHLIQAEKIFSLFNCPNCKYTWMLFQKYLREMILESWSLFIDKADREYYSKEQTLTYEEYLNRELTVVIEQLKIYIPQLENQNQIYDIVPTFMNIFDIVVAYYENAILSSFPAKIAKCFSTNGTEGFVAFFIGFRPYTLVDNSGARINTLGNDEQEQKYISDPELKYMKKQPDGYKPILMSITEKIDDIFNQMCKKINEFVGSNLGLKFFLRRTLGGCEFGLCFDFEIENINNDIINDYKCLVDKDPLLVFTISVRSMIPILAGILIIGLVYITKLALTIGQWISGFNIELAGQILKKTAKIVLEKLASQFLQDKIESFCNSICGFLINVVKNQIHFLESFDSDAAFIFDLLLRIGAAKDFSQSGDELNNLFGEKSFFKLNSNFGQKMVFENLPVKYFMKIGFLLMLSFGTFMYNFHFKKKGLKYQTKKVASEYDKDQQTDLAVKQNSQYVDDFDSFT